MNSHSNKSRRAVVKLNYNWEDIMTFRNPNTGKFAKATETQAVVDVSQVSENAKIAAKAMAEKKRRAKKTAKKRAKAKQNQALREESGLFKGLKALTKED